MLLLIFLLWIHGSWDSCSWNLKLWRSTVSDQFFSSFHSISDLYQVLLCQLAVCLEEPISCYSRNSPRKEGSCRLCPFYFQHTEWQWSEEQMKTVRWENIGIMEHRYSIKKKCYYFWNRVNCTAQPLPDPSNLKKLMAWKNNFFSKVLSKICLSFISIS